MFKLLKKSKKSQARLGRIKTVHGEITSPFFMPVATRGAVKHITTDELKEIGAQIVLANTYHLFLRPETKVIAKAGGLHKFMNWSGPILTDSGGFQVFSLAKQRKINSKGVEFRSDINGEKFLLTPEKVIEIENHLGSDIAMVLDECTPWPCSLKEATLAVERTSVWAKRAKKKWKKLGSKNSLFGIIQGSVYKDLRLKSLEKLISLEFDGFAIGGLSVGEPEEKMLKMVRLLTPQMPEDKPRYLMGVGVPSQIVECVKAGIDMFDCVIPTREARHGRLYSFRRKDVRLKFYETFNITKAKFSKDFKPINSHCRCFTCRNYSRAYLRHLFLIREPLGQRLATIHNLAFWVKLMERIRKAIKNNEF